MFDSLLKTVAVLFIFSFRSAFKLTHYLVASLLQLIVKPESPTPPAVMARPQPAPQVIQSTVTVKPPAKLSPFGQRTISEKSPVHPFAPFVYATARKPYFFIDRASAVGKAQLLALPTRMAVQWRRFQPLRVDDPKFRIHAVGKKTTLAIDTSEMSPQGLDEVYNEVVRVWRPSPEKMPPAAWVDSPHMIYPQVVIHEHLARQLRLEQPVWRALPTPIKPEAPVILPSDNQYWAISLRARTRFEPPAGMLLGSSSTVAK